MIKEFISFLGPVRNGHTLVASLLSAHDAIAISIEVNIPNKVFKYNYSDKQIQNEIITNCKNRKKLNRGGYDYTMKEHKSFGLRKIQVIGDTQSGVSLFRELPNENRFKKFSDIVGLNMKWVILHRNPFDVIHSSNLMNKGGIQYNLNHFKNTMKHVQNAKKYSVVKDNFFEFHLDDFCSEPKRYLEKLCSFLGVEADDDYLDTCAKKVFPNPRQTYSPLDWTLKQKDELKAFIKRTHPLRRYLK